MYVINYNHPELLRRKPIITIINHNSTPLQSPAVLQIFQFLRNNLQSQRSFKFAQQNMNRQFTLMPISSLLSTTTCFTAIVHRRLMANLDISIVFKILLQCFQDVLVKLFLAVAHLFLLKVQNRSLIINRDTTTELDELSLERMEQSIIFKAKTELK